MTPRFASRRDPECGPLGSALNLTLCHMSARCAGRLAQDPSAPSRGRIAASATRLARSLSVHARVRRPAGAASFFKKRPQLAENWEPGLKSPSSTTSGGIVPGVAGKLAKAIVVPWFVGRHAEHLTFGSNRPGGLQFQDFLWFLGKVAFKFVLVRHSPVAVEHHHAAR